MDGFKERLSHLVLKIQEVTDKLYKQDIKTAYKLLSVVLVDITKFIDEVFEIKNDDGSIKFDISGLMESLSEALQAMENADTVLLADILQYEIIEKLNDIENNI